MVMRAVGRLAGLGVLTRLLPVLLVIACSPIFRSHGYVPAEEDLSLIEVGVDTRETVEAVVGPPGAAGLLTESGWYYVQSRWETRGGAAPRETDRQVLAISFTEDGKVENIEKFSLADGKVVALSRRITQSNVKGISVIRRLLGNIGGISADQILE